MMTRSLRHTSARTRMVLAQSRAPARVRAPARAFGRWRRASVTRATGGGASEDAARVQVFDPRRKVELQLLGAREELMSLIERKAPDEAITAVIDELKTLYDGEARAPARDARLLGKWRLIWSAQASTANPFQRAFGKAARNYQIIASDALANVVELGPVVIDAKASCEAVSEVRSEVVISTVDVRVGGTTLKTFTLEPRPGAGKGWVEQIYLDDTMRVSVGNKGSLFCHVKDGDAARLEEASNASASASSSTALARVDVD